jgi:hypothetical protein
MRKNTIRSVAVAVAVASTCFTAFAHSAAPQAQTQKPAPAKPKPAPVTALTFATPEEAVAAAVKAAASGPEALMTLLGPGGRDLVYSSDAVADQNDRADFVRLATEKTAFEKDPSNPSRVTVLIGSDGFPTAIPLVQKKGRWLWDAAGGRYELLLRRIGSNELDAITICRGFVEAQWQYAAMDPDKTGIRQYAQRIISTPGKHDGLYWPPEAGGPESPISENVARAIAQGYTSKTQPYRGYFLKVLTAQGPSAPLGAMDFMVRGHMIGGFALVAWPAQYRVSGVKTFIVGSDGIVYERDLGPDTVKIASAMTRYDPGKGWTVTDDASDATRYIARR